MSQNNKTTFVKQAAILGLAGILVRVMGFLYRMPLTNLLGDPGNALYGASYNVYNLFLILSSAGLPVAISRLVSQRIALDQHKNAHKVFVTALYLAIIMGAIGSLSLWLGARMFSNMLGFEDCYYSMVALAPTVLLVAIMAVFRGYFQGMNNSAPTAISQLIEGLFNAVFSVLLAYILAKKSIALAAAGGTLGTGVGAFFGLITLIVIYFIVRKKILIDVNNDKDENAESTMFIANIVIKTAIPIIIGTAVFSISNLIDTKMASSRLAASGVLSPEQIRVQYGLLTGKYVLISTLPVAISTALATASIPNISRYITAKDYKNANAKINTGIRLAMVLSIPASVGIGVLATPILHLLFPRFPDGGNLVRAGALSIIFLALSQIATGMLQGMGKMKIPAFAAIIGAIAKIPLNYFLISMPNILIMGAIISTTACYMVTSGINLFFLSKEMKELPDLKGAFVKPTISSILMGVSCYFVYELLFYITNINGISVIFAICVGVLVYFIAMAKTKGFNREDMLMMPLGSKIERVMSRYGCFTV